MQRLNLFLVIGAILLATSAVCAAAPEAINLNFNSAKYVSLPQTISKIFVGNGSIVKVKQLSPATNEIVITAQEKSGSTNIFVWTADGMRYEYFVTVSDEDVGMAAIIEREIGLPNVRVKKIGDKILLNGTVDNENEHAHAVQIAQFFAKGSAPAVATNPITGVDTSRESTKSAESNVVDGLIVLNPSQNFFEAQIEQAINLPDVHVKKIGNSVMLTGTVETEKEHLHAVQIATVFANNTEIPNNMENQNNVKILSLDGKENSVRDAQVSKVNVIDRIGVLNPQSILETQIEQAIGLPDVHVKMVDKRILLTGTVQNQYERNYAIQIARLYVGSGSDSSLSFGSNVNPTLSTQSATDNKSNTTLSNTNKVEDGGSVIDLLQMLNPTQIRLEAQIIEINSDKAKNLGITYGESGEGGVFSVGEKNDRTVTTEVYRYWNESNNRWESYSLESGSSVEPFNRRPLKWIQQRFGPINATIHALVSDGKARILSRPSVMTMSGEQATIQIGGEIPYTISNVNGTTVNFRNYGIILQFKPIVDAQNRIVSTVSTEVSNLSGQAVNGQPIITTRRADSVVTLDSGSSIIIGGLMDSSEGKVVSKIPLLGNIPILGEFFKYSSKRRDKRELIILVTPYIVSGYESSRAGMSDAMRDYYHEGQREKNHLRDVDLNEPPPPLPAKKTEKKQPRNPEKVIKREDNLDNNVTQEDKAPEKKSGWSFGIFGDAF